MSVHCLLHNSRQGWVEQGSKRSSLPRRVGPERVIKVVIFKVGLDTDIITTVHPFFRDQIWTGRFWCPAPRIASYTGMDDSYGLNEEPGLHTHSAGSV